MKYQATVKWPKTQPQIDWIDRVTILENWLTTFIGVEHLDWGWVNHTIDATVAFKNERNKTLFLLTWS